MDPDVRERSRPDTASPAHEPDADRLWRWQTRLLPFMVGAISLLAMFFFVSTYFQLEKLNRVVAFEPGAGVGAVLADLDSRAKEVPAAEAVELLKWKAMVLLEEDVVRHRYQQVNATLQMRAWTRHMGFVTGMMMAFVGAIFILSKLSERETRLSSELQGIKGSLATSSPGIVLAVLGTALMLVTLTANYSFTTRDAPVYLARPPGLAPADLPPPEAIDDPEATEKELFGPPTEGGNDARSETSPPQPDAG